MKPEEAFYVSEADGSMCRPNPNGTVTTFDECEVADLLNKLREALGFYADRKNWLDKKDRWGSTDIRARIKSDEGEIARTALKRQKGETDGKD